MRNTTEIPDCISADLDAFPSDGLTKQQRIDGWIVIHCLISCYFFIGVAILCNEYFVPSVQKMSQVFNISSDVAGATLMAGATSAPEFYANIMGTFVIENDIGVGTILGSGIFNVLGVTAICGLYPDMNIELNWWPITRDSVAYVVSIVLLILVLDDSKVTFYEASYFCGFYVAYMYLMYKNKTINKTMQETKFAKLPCFQNDAPDIEEETIFDNSTTTLPHLIKFPFEESCLEKINWSIQWPLYFAFFFTIPDCRVARLANCFFVSLVMSCLWMVFLSYVITWMLTIIGYTFRIPDSVMGLCILAMGTSIPEVMSSLSVARKGQGSMSICNSIGSSTFNILLCLGLPWFVKTTFFPKIPGDYSLYLHSATIKYDSVIMLASVLILYIAFCVNNFKFGKYVGLICLISYIFFLIITVILEMNIVFDINELPC